MSDRWSATQVSALAPDSSSLSAARGLASATKWVESGHADGDPPSLWGLCKGSGSKPYQTCVDLAEPAYRCSCPSRKFPCKHALGLLLLWSAGTVSDSEPPAWVKEWHEGRADRAAKSKARAEVAATPEGAAAQEKAAQKRSAQRANRVAAGLTELDQWLCDQVRTGIAGLDQAGYGHWDQMAARLVDAQAPTLAGEVRRLASVAAGSRDDWPSRMLAELSLLRLVVAGYSRVETLPAPLAASIRARIGFTVQTEQVLATPALRDQWQVIGVRDEIDDRITTRRVWLRGRESRRPALVLSFAGYGQPLAVDLVVGTMIDASLCFYPGAAPLRALVAERHAAPAPCARPAPAVGVQAALAEYAHAIAAEPWLTNWPVLIEGVFAPGPRWQFVDAAGDALPLHPAAAEPWSMFAAAGGDLGCLAAEWTSAGLRPLTLFHAAEVVTA